MADDTFNGATCTFASVSVGSILSMNYAETAAKADTTGSGDSVKTFGAGIPEVSLSVEIVGGTDLAIGDTGALAVTWGDIGSSTDGSIAAAEVGGVSTTGAMDGTTTSTIEFHTAAPTS